MASTITNPHIWMPVFDWDNTFTYSQLFLQNTMDPEIIDAPFPPYIDPGICLSGPLGELPDAKLCSIPSSEHGSNPWIVDADGCDGPFDNFSTSTLNQSRIPQSNDSTQFSSRKVCRSPKSNQKKKLPNHKVSARPVKAKQQRYLDEKRPVRSHDKIQNRNRISAMQYRRRKKINEQELQEKLDIVHSRHSILQAEYEKLKEEVSNIKTTLMVHAACRNPDIDKWIKNEATNFVKFGLS